VLELAANMGPFTPLLSRLVGPRGVVHTVEPNPTVVHQLHAQARPASTPVPRG